MPHLNSSVLVMSARFLMAGSSQLRGLMKHTWHRTYASCPQVVGEYVASAADKAAEEARAVRDAAGDAAQATKERAAAAAHNVQARIGIRSLLPTTSIP